MEQEITLNAHNKQVFPAGHTAGFDTSLIKWLVVLSFVFLFSGCQSVAKFDKSSIGTVMVVDKEVSEQEWNEALSHKVEYNYLRDTNIDELDKIAASVAVFRTLDEGYKEAYVWTDLSFDNIGLYHETNEHFVEIYYANEVWGTFVVNEVSDTSFMAGSDFGVYGKNGIFVGSPGFDCDPIVWLYFYARDSEKKQTHLLYEYRNRDYYLCHYGDEISELVWYKDALYWKGYSRLTDTMTYHKLTLTIRNKELKYLQD